ncbi:MAG: hypothetical protein AAGG80_04370 [Pseudomonadota bacterium]
MADTKKGGGMFGGLSDRSAYINKKHKNFADVHKDDDESGGDASGGGSGKRLHGFYGKEKLFKLIHDNSKFSANAFASFLNKTHLTNEDELKKSPISEEASADAVEADTLDNKSEKEKEKQKRLKEKADKAAARAETTPAEDIAYVEADDVASKSEQSHMTAERVRDGQRSVIGDKKAGSVIGADHANAQGFTRQVELTGGSIEKGAGAVRQGGQNAGNALTGEGSDSNYYGAGFGNNQGAAVRQVLGGTVGTALFQGIKTQQSADAQNAEAASSKMQSHSNTPNMTRRR